MGAPLSLSVVIPTYNRADLLPRCLKALVEQTLPADRFEICVVDDGSTDGTSNVVRDLTENFPRYKILCIQGRHCGPAFARNLGIAHTSAPILLFMDDDVLAFPDLLNEHLLWHTERHPELHAAVLGLVEPSETQPLTRLNKWANQSGVQFGYNLISKEDDVPYSFFYTANLSLKRAFLEKERFDESFPYAAWEDIELAFRLKKRGLRIVLNRAARAQHEHFPSLWSFIRRTSRSGYAWMIFCEKHGLEKPASLGAWQKGRLALIVLRELLKPLAGRVVNNDALFGSISDWALQRGYRRYRSESRVKRRVSDRSSS